MKGQSRRTTFFHVKSTEDLSVWGFVTKDNTLLQHNCLINIKTLLALGDLFFYSLLPISASCVLAKNSENVSLSLHSPNSLIDFWWRFSLTQCKEDDHLSEVNRKFWRMDPILHNEPSNNYPMLWMFQRFPESRVWGKVFVLTVDYSGGSIFLANFEVLCGMCHFKGWHIETFVHDSHRHG